MEHVVLPVLSETGLERIGGESLEMERLGPDSFRLLHSPAFVDGLARNDEITVDESVIEGFRLLRRGGWVAAILVFRDKEQKEGVVADRAAQLPESAVVEGGPGATLVLSFPVSVGFPVIQSSVSRLLENQTGATWWFGNVYDRSRKPIGWWLPA